MKGSRTIGLIDEISRSYIILKATLRHLFSEQCSHLQCLLSKGVGKYLSQKSGTVCEGPKILKLSVQFVVSRL